MSKPVTNYQERVYALLKQIPEGRVSTYAALSKALASSPRAVGGALRTNPFAPEVPCHRVIGANGVRQILENNHTLSHTCTAVCRWLQRRKAESSKWCQSRDEVRPAQARRRSLRPQWHVTGQVENVEQLHCLME